MRGAGSGGGGRRKDKQARTSLLVRGSHAVLCLALAAGVSAKGAEPDGSTSAPSGLLSGLFHEKPKAPAPTPKKANQPVSQPTTPRESTEAERQRYMHAWFRRVEVCDRLRNIAQQTGNEALMNQATELEERASALYRQQTARLPLAAQEPVAVLASDREVSTRPRPGAMATAPTLTPGLEGADVNRQQSSRAPARMGGSMDQREQAILKGTSMGEERP